ncbi:RNA polymerase sigma factor, sigma-70 family [Amycolatopsis pretoriensis]|uniref:RNA polymerase sigma factor, sigma-70 family n=1 Tax=Amycolatopsis pretoriensis TaxID=218821 RepID=A0A1H5QWZ5_9PSEU|nr:sigma-70 family RNA polymerase sigma factor [Amycolatopsis pretoriensis]SEF30676.1 RNA polymerase sigma factor, sigma-70 family [Amycolatopsis pretoriensis]
MSDNDDLVDRLVHDAVRGNPAGWREIVRRYTPLVRSVCHRHGLAAADIDDVTGVVWLRLVTHLADLRTPAALPGWLSVTTQRECLAVLRHHARQTCTDEWDIADTRPEPDAQLLELERRTTLRHAIATLPDRDRHLMSMLFRDPPAPYTQISTTLRIPVGTIGPTRQRCLGRLRRNPAITALITAAAA